MVPSNATVNHAGPMAHVCAITVVQVHGDLLSNRALKQTLGVLCDNSKSLNEKNVIPYQR